MVFDIDYITGFEWDQGNNRKNYDKHGVSQGEAEQVFFDESLLVASDDTHSISEPRYHAFGATLQGRRLHVTFTLRGSGTRIRVISARDMSRKERNHYE